MNNGTATDRRIGGANSTSRQREKNLRPDLNFMHGDPMEAYNTNMSPFDLLANKTDS